MPDKPAVRKRTKTSPSPRPESPAHLPEQRAEEKDTAVPRLPRVYVPRARLWSRLEDATSSGVTLVVAPVGAGKTLGVAGWLRTTGRAADTTWIHADATWSPDRIEKLLPDPAQGEPRSAHLLVVDDAHLLPIATQRVLDDRLVNSPETLRLVLLSRWDLSLTRLVPELMGDFSILRGDVLRMDDEECAPLVAEHARTDHPEVIRSVVEHSHGWVAAVVLASRAIAAAPDAVATARRYATGDASIADRLASEVFAALQSRQRHLLLCVANELVVTTEQAAHLTHDARAGEILAELETTGLLVSRVPADSAAPESSRYRIHPLLVEAVRRRLVAGGVDVAQAQATILRAVRLDLARGETGRAFSRLVAANLADEAARVLAEEGVTMLMRGAGSAITAFARAHPEIVESAPDTWFVLGLTRWLDNDASGAGHWLDRVMAEAKELEHRDALCPRIACARLLRARMGAEPVVAAIGHARKVVLAHMRANEPEPLLPLLVAELGMAQAWLGDLTEAEVNLTTAVTLSRARGLTGLTAASLSHLALTLYMQGRENACIEIANGVLEDAVDRRSNGVRRRPRTARAPARHALRRPVAGGDDRADDRAEHSDAAAHRRPCRALLGQAPRRQVGADGGFGLGRRADPRGATHLVPDAGAPARRPGPRTRVPGQPGGRRPGVAGLGRRARLAGRPRRGAAAHRTAARAGERPQGRPPGVRRRPGGRDLLAAGQPGPRVDVRGTAARRDGPFRRRDRPPPGRGHAHRDPPQRGAVPGLEPSGHAHGDPAVTARAGDADGLDPRDRRRGEGTARHRLGVLADDRDPARAHPGDRSDGAARR